MTNQITDKHLDEVGNPTSVETEGSDVGQNVNTGSSDISIEDLKQKYEALQSSYSQDKGKWEMDLNRMKSSLQRGAAKETSQLRQRVEDLKSKLDEATVSGMTEEQRREYELKRIQERNEELEQRFNEQNATLREQADIRQIKDAFVQKFGRFGLSAEDIDVSSRDNAVASAWTKIGELMDTGPNSGASATGEDGKKVVNQTTETKVIGEGGKVPTAPSDPMLILRKFVATNSGQKVEDVTEETVIQLINQNSIDVNEIIAREISD